MKNTIPSAIRDNRKRGSVGEFLREKIKHNSKLSIVSAYFTIYAYEALKNKLDNIHNLNFLFGEPRFIKSIDPNKIDKQTFKIEIDELKLLKQLKQKRVAKECSVWIKEKVIIKSIKQINLLHGKMYHIDNNGIEDAILGSSNFTLNGLGLGSNPNIELNLEVDSKRDNNDLKEWFYDIWNNIELVEDVTDKVLEYLKQLHQNNSPEFIYYKTLYHIFEKFLAEQDKISLLEDVKLIDTQIWNILFEFQKDGVKGAINKIINHNGCIIADSVGLGKTFEALAIIKYFELRNNRVLVLCPKKLRENWTVYQAHNNDKSNFFIEDKFSYSVLSHTDLSREKGKTGDINLATINWGNYDLIVIDESHNFRNNVKGKRDKDGNTIRKSRYEKLMEDIIQEGLKTKVLLLSATPVNTNLKDLRNQILFITAGIDNAFSETIGISSIKETTRITQWIFTNWVKEKEKNKLTSKDLIEDIPPSFFKLLDELTIARSRKHILKYYKDSITKLGGFPKREKPSSIYSEIDLKGRFMSYDKLNDEISNYKLSLFSPFKYLKEEFQEYYEEKASRRIKYFSQGDRENFLIGMMKINFLKRLESSIKSFAITMGRTIDKIEKLEEKIKHFKKIQIQNPDKNYAILELEALNEEDEELQDVFTGTKLKYNLAHFRLDEWLKDLSEDNKQLDILYNSALSVKPERDAKLAKLKELIKEKVENPSVNKKGKLNKKVLIFTAFADTVYYLYDELKDWIRKELKVNIAMLSGGAKANKTTLGKNDFNRILTNFSPISKNRDLDTSMPQDEEIDILIATDCISEGQNLQDCDYLINYDIHWNPVRVIQRFGRIDRIGSLNKSVSMINFWPTEDLNKYINLKNRVEARMALVDISATASDNILETDEIKDLIKDDLKYRDKQLLRLKEEILDLEDFNDNISLTDFTLDDFRIELLKYLEKYKIKLAEAPLGLYAITPSNNEYKQIKEGIIFCLKQKSSIKENSKINPLEPYFLVYITKDGLIRYNFTNPQNILEIYRILCSNKEKPYEELCKLFDKETDNGKNIELYSNLLSKSIIAIKKRFEKKAIANLFSNRDGTIPNKDKQIKDTSDLELITWLIIKK